MCVSYITYIYTSYTYNHMYEFMYISCIYIYHRYSDDIDIETLPGHLHGRLQILASPLSAPKSCRAATQKVVLRCFPDVCVLVY